MDSEDDHSPPTLDEYGEASPMRVAFCSRLTEEQYEDQTSQSTKNALDDLFASLESNPALYKRVLQRRKREEMENSGWFSYMKAQALVLVGKEEAFSVTENEYSSKLTSMKDQMSKVYQYSEGLRESNGVKRSARLLEKKRKQAAAAAKRAAAAAATPEDSENSPPVNPITSSGVRGAHAALAPSKLNQVTSCRAAMPPPPAPVYPKDLLSPRPKLHSNKRKSATPATTESPTNKLCKKQLLSAINRRKSPKHTSPRKSSALASKPVSPKADTSKSSPTPSLQSSTAADSATSSGSSSPTAVMDRPNPALLMADIVDGRKHLKPATRSVTSPGGTPSKQKKKADGTPSSLFNAELLHKFRNAHLQSPSPTHSTNTSFTDSLDSSGWLSPDMHKQRQACA